MTTTKTNKRPNLDPESRRQSQHALQALLKASYPVKDEPAEAIIQLLVGLEHFAYWKNLDFDDLLDAAEVRYKSVCARERSAVA